MKKTYFTVGPSQVYPTLDQHIRTALREQISSLSHRGKEFQRMYQHTEKLLKELLSIPDDYVVFFLGSSIEAMERIIENTVGETSFHFVDGAFSQKAASIAEDLKKEVLKIPAPENSQYEFKKIIIPKKAELIFITENDTSTGLIFPHKEIYALKKRYPEVLVAVDLVSSAPYSSIDFSKIDMAFFSGQKGFGIPAGMSVLVVSLQALRKAEQLKKRNQNIGSYHSFPSLLKSRENFMTPETPNILNIYLLEKVLQDMLDIGIEAIRDDIDAKAALLYDFFDNHRQFAPFVSDTAFRSSSTLVIEVKGGSKYIQELLAKKGIIVGSGYGENKDKHIRIANFPAHTREHVKKLIRYLRHSGLSRISLE